MSDPEIITRPAKLRVDPYKGVLWGNNGRYEKRLGELAGVFHDDADFEASVRARGADSLIYWVESSDTQHSSGGLITGISVLEPGHVGGEYFMTRGHLHAESECGEMYYCLSGTGVMLLETVDGDVDVVQLSTGEAVYVPGGWIHRSVNVGTDRFQTLFSYSALAGQDYGIIGDAGGMQTLIVAGVDGWQATANDRHTGYRGRS